MSRSIPGTEPRAAWRPAPRSAAVSAHQLARRVLQPQRFHQHLPVEIDLFTLQPQPFRSRNQVALRIQAMLLFQYPRRQRVGIVTGSTGTRACTITGPPSSSAVTKRMLAPCSVSAGGDRPFMGVQTAKLRQQRGVDIQ